MNQNGDKSEKYERISAERKERFDAILNCPSKKITVVGGPGTGKTYLFKAFLSGKQNCLTLTFVNSLVEDLSLDLCTLCEVKTLHGYARNVLESKVGSKVKVFPKLSRVIERDAKILIGVNVDFDSIFDNKEDDNPHINLYRKRKKYYDNYYGYSSIIYAAVKLFEQSRNKIPAYEHILVDEFQDFNKLEVSLIELLAEKSPVLLAGDDDQALYGFKGASADHIRQRHDEANTDYASFTLPYCSRCTRVIIDAVNDLIAKATENGHLCNRIVKQFWYFQDKEKARECELYPMLAYAQVFSRQIPWFIEKRMNDIAGEQQGQFSSLIIAPTKVQCRSLVTSLREKGFASIESIQSEEDKDIVLLDGLKLLMENNVSNLGWRIVAEKFLTPSKFKKLLTQTTENAAQPICEMIDQEIREKVKGILKTLKALQKGETVNEKNLNSVLEEMRIDGHEIILNALKDKIISNYQRPGNPGLRKVPIKVTTIQSSKGLSADFVFITYFDDRYFIKNRDKSKISDQDICNFIVSLTRAKKKVFLISSNKMSQPTFLGWIDSSRIEKISL